MSKIHNFSKSNIPIRLESNPKTSALITTSMHKVTLQWLYQCFNKGRNNFATYKRQTSSTTIPSTTINKNTINNPKVNKQQCYYYHNTGNIDEQMSQKCVPCKSMSILPDNFITMDRAFIHQGRIRSSWSITLKPIQIGATTQ